MIIIYEKATGEVLYNEDRPVNYEDRKPVYNVTVDPETGEESRELLGYTMYYNPKFFATAQVPDTFRERYYNENNA